MAAVRKLFGTMATATLAGTLFFALGCGGSSVSQLIGFLGTNPFLPPTGDGTGGGTGGTGGDSGFFGGGAGPDIDPCNESQSRKFVRVVMRNQNPDDFIHYFFVAVARINGDTYPDGAVCPDDIGLYESFGYVQIPEGQTQIFGNFCFTGPSLVYYHRQGAFQGAATGGGGANLASAIAPAQGTNPTFDSFFNASGAQIPVPNEIIFHNPGAGDGALLKVSINDLAPCDQTVNVGDPDCLQDAFYYVDQSDLPSGSNTLGIGSFRRVPAEIQGTGCQVTGFQNPAQVLAGSGDNASTAADNEFLRGGTITYAFIRDDQTPAIPQLLWRVTDSGGALAHDFDPRAGIN